MNIIYISRNGNANEEKMYDLDYVDHLYRFLAMVSCLPDGASIKLIKKKIADSPSAVDEVKNDDVIEFGSDPVSEPVVEPVVEPEPEPVIIKSAKERFQEKYQNRPDCDEIRIINLLEKNQNKGMRVKEITHHFCPNTIYTNKDTDRINSLIHKLVRQGFMRYEIKEGFTAVRLYYLAHDWETVEQE